MESLALTAHKRRMGLVAAFVSVALVGPVTWMALDREQPFSRTGQIIPVDPKNCGLTKGSGDAILPGGCVRIDLHIENLRSCRRTATDNVRRTLVDALGVTRPIGVISSAYRGEGDTNVTHYFILPAPMPKGIASYTASACFACNPLQYILNWPVCVDKPDIYFEVK